MNKRLTTFLTYIIAFITGFGILFPIFNKREEVNISETVASELQPTVLRDDENFWNFTDGQITPTMHHNKVWNYIKSHTTYTFSVKNLSNVVRDITHRLNIGLNQSNERQKISYTVYLPYPGNYYLNFTIDNPGVSFSIDKQNHTVIATYEKNGFYYTLNYNYSDLLGYGLSFYYDVNATTIFFGMNRSVTGGSFPRTMTLDPTFLIADASSSATFNGGRRKIARTSNGVLYVAYQTWTVTTQQRMAESRDNGSTWSPNFYPDSNQTGKRNSTGTGVLAMNSQNVLYFAWWGQVNSRSNNWVRFRRFFPSNRSWSKNIINVTGTPETVITGLVMVIDSNDNAYLFYINKTTNRIHMKLYYAANNSFHTGQWTELTPITYTFEPSVCIDSSGTIYLTLTIGSSGSYKVINRKFYISNLTKNKEYFNVSGAYVSDQLFPSSLVDKNGNVHIVWAGGIIGKIRNIRYRVWYTSNNTWNPQIINLTREPTIAQTYPAIQLNGISDLYVLWHGFHNGSTADYQIRSINYTSSSNTWSQPTNWTRGQAGTMHHTFPSMMHAWYPNVSGIQTNIPIHGVVSIYTNSSTAYYLNSSRVDWGVPSAANNPPTCVINSGGASRALNESADIPLRPTLYFWCNDTDADILDINMYTNVTGTWVHVQSNNTMNPGLFHYNYSNVAIGGTKYFIQVSVSDGTVNLTYFWFWFRTRYPAVWGKGVGWNISFKNTSAWKKDAHMHNFNLSFKNTSEFDDIRQTFNISFRNISTTQNINNDWNISFRNASLVKSIKNNWNVSFKNSSIMNNINQDFNISFQNQTIMTSIKQHFNISFRNTSLIRTIKQNFNISFKNSSTLKTIKNNWNISFKNSSFIKNIDNNWNVSFKNISGFKNIFNNWNISFKNTSTAKSLDNNFNISFRNTLSPAQNNNRTYRCDGVNHTDGTNSSGFFGSGTNRGFNVTNPFVASNYTSIYDDDVNLLNVTTSVAGEFAEARFPIYVGENINNITKIEITFYGYGGSKDAGPSYHYGIQYAVKDSGEWTFVSGHYGGTVMWQSTIKGAWFNQWISNNMIYLAAQSTHNSDGANVSFIYIDHIRVRIYTDSYPENRTHVNMPNYLKIHTWDNKNNPYDIYVYTNMTGSWELINSTLQVHNGTKTFTNTSLFIRGKKNYWSVNMTNGVYWNNQTYWFDTSYWEMFKAWNVSFRNQTSWDSIKQNFNISFKNKTTVWSVVKQNFNFSFKNTTTSTNLNQNFNISFKNQTAYNPIKQTWNISFKNISLMKSLDNNFNISFKNQTFFESLKQHFNVSFRNSSVSADWYGRFQWNVSFSNTSTMKSIDQNFNFSFRNTSLAGWNNVGQNWNISFRNISLMKNVKNNWNISFKNSSTMRNIWTNWNISFKNKTSVWHNINNSWNISFKNTTWNNQFEWNVSFRNITWNNQFEWNISFRNKSSNYHNLNQSWNISFRNSSVGNITLTIIYPLNKSINIGLQPLLTINLSNTAGEEMTVTWSWGFNTACTEFLGISNNCYNGTHSKQLANATTLNTRYYWRVAVNDSNDWVNSTQYFTTLTRGGGIQGTILTNYLWVLPIAFTFLIVGWLVLGKKKKRGEE